MTHFFTNPHGQTVSADDVALAYIKRHVQRMFDDGSGGTPPAAVTLPPAYWMEAGQ